MKKKLLLFAVTLFMFIPFINASAQEVSTFTINSNEVEDGIVKDGVYYGNVFSLWTTTPDKDKYETFVSICSMDSSKCIVEDSGSNLMLDPGTYKIGYRVVAKDGYEIGYDIKWVINGVEMTPSECGSTNNNDLGCENFFTVTLLDWKEHLHDFRFETKLDYKPGDTVDNTVKVTSTKGNIVDTKIYWFKSLSDIKPGDADKAITKFEKGIYYLVVEGKAEKGVFLDFNDEFYMNGKQYKNDDAYVGLGDYNYFYLALYKLDLTSIKVEPENAKDEEEKKAAEETSKVLSKAMDDLAAGKEVKGISVEVANKVKEAIDSGKTIKTEITAEQIKIDDLSDDVKKAFEEKKENTQNVIGYFDINLSITADGENLGKITELQDKIGITVDAADIVKNLPKVESGKTRIYKVLRMHDGVIDVLDAELHSDGSLTIYTDRFSNYAIIYEDVDNTNPKTDDNVLFYISLLGLSIIGIAGTIVFTKKVKFN